MEEKKPTGYPSIDKPWLKYYTEEATKAIPPEGTIYEYIWEKNQDHLDDTALVYFGRKISYGKLFNNIDKVASAFSALGVRKGDIVAIALPNIPESIYCVYALNKIGAIADMVDLRSKGDILLHYLTETKATVAVICDLFAQNTFDIIAGTNIQKLVVASPFDSLYAPIRFAMKCKSKKLRLPLCAMHWKHFLDCKKQEQIHSVGGSDDVAAIFHTSGTTGLPKGVMLTNKNFNAMAVHAKLSGLKFNYGQSMMNQVPPFLAYNALCATHMPLALHMQIIMLPEYRPDKFAENIMKLKPNCAIAGPADWNNFLENETLKRKKVNLSYLVSLISGSDAMSQKSKDAVNALVQKNGCQERVLEGYGMTEIGSAACVNVPQHNEDRSVGIPMPFNNFCIYDNDAEKELPYNERGEICMHGPTVMKGYYNNPAETANVLKVHPDGTVWLHSGDLGYITEDGCVYLDGRLKRIIIRHDGIKVSPFAVEETVMKHKDVTACCAVGVFDQEHQMGQVPVVFFTVSEDVEWDNILNGVKALCDAELAENYRPHNYRIVADLPLTPNGKVDYRTLEKEAEKGQWLK